MKEAPVFDLPLFPLDTVLFPGMPIRLHIFEERYRIMMQRCLEHDLAFGVVLIQTGVEAGGPLAEPVSVGCTAQIVHAERLSQGRLNLVATGEERFRLSAIDRNLEPYLIGQAAFFPMPNPDPDALAREARALRKQVIYYLRTLNRAGQLPAHLEHLPNEPLLFLHLAATMLQAPNYQKQRLLEASDTLHLARGLRSLYRRETALLERLLQRSKSDDLYRLN